VSLFVVIVLAVLTQFRGTVISLETKVPGSESTRNESTTRGTFTPGSESTWERKFQLPYLRCLRYLPSGGSRTAVLGARKQLSSGSHLLWHRTNGR